MKPVWPEEATPKVVFDLKQMLGNGLTFKDNINCAIITIDAQHGVETRVANPLRQVPLAFIPIDSFCITTIGGVSNGVARELDGYPVLNTSRTDGYVGVTCRYAAPFGRVSVLRNATQAIGTAAATPVQFDTVTDTAAGALSCDTATTSGSPPTNSKIVCAVPGFVLVTCSALFDTDPGGGVREFWIQKNNTKGPAWGDSCGTVGYQGSSMAAQILVAAGDYLQIGVYQDSGGNLNLLGGANGARFQARYVEPPASSLARVRGILVGA